MFLVKKKKKKFENNKIKSTQMNLFDSFSPLNKTLKLFGISTFEVRLQNDGKVKVAVEWKSVIWTICWLLILAYLIKYNLIKGAHEPGEKSKIILSGWHWLITFQLISSVLIIFWNFYKRKNVEKFYHLIEEFDECVSELKIFFIKNNH